jgi:predicted ArsR family transcriptional regulator
MADPLRARLVGLFASAPATIQELAAQLEVPATRLYYHIHLLEKHGLIQVIDSHPKGGTIEKVYRASARQFIVDKKELASSGAKAAKHADVLIDFALTETGKAIRKSVNANVIDLRQTAPHPRALQIRRGSGKLSTAQASRFHQRLTQLVEEFASMEPEKGAQAEYFLALAFFPTSVPDAK